MNLVELNAANADSSSTANKLVWTVPQNTAYRILYGHLALTTVGAGTRWVAIEIKNSAGLDATEAVAGVGQGAGVTYHYSFKEGIFRETTFLDSSLEVPLPRNCIVPSGWTITLWDRKNIAVGADSLVALLVVERANLSAMKV